MSGPRSLRWRLLLGGAVGVALAALVAAVLLGAAFQRAGERAVEQRLADDLDRLTAQLERDPDSGAVQPGEGLDDARFDRIFSGWYWSIATAGGVVDSRSSWDQQPLADALAAAGSARRLSTARGPRGQLLRVLAQRVRFARGDAPVALAVAADVSVLQAEATRFRWLVAGSVALIAAVLLAVLQLQVGYGLRPLATVGRTLARIRAGDPVRFQPARLPDEIAPLAGEVNALLDEHARRVERARHAAQDLAHALKTPLAVLSVEAGRAAPDLPAQVLEQVARMRLAVERHLAAGLAVDVRQATAVRPVLETLVALMRRIHAGRALAITIDCDPALRVRIAQDTLEDLLGNLLDNACKWAQGRVRVSAAAAPDAVVLQVEDDGPGLSPEAAGRALGRGVRLDERVAGSGYGLAIVREGIEAHGGTLALERSTALGGLSARLRCPAAPAVD